MTTARRLHVIQGQYRVSRGDDECCLTTVLGSCVSVCLVEPRARAGGMNHFMLPAGRPDTTSPASFGVNAMELLINALLKAGAVRHRLRAHVFGGARMMSGLGDIGAYNSAFARDFLAREGIRTLTFSTGGDKARRVTLWPALARVEEELIGGRVAEPPPSRPSTGNVEFF